MPATNFSREPNNATTSFPINVGLYGTQYYVHRIKFRDLPGLPRRFGIGLISELQPKRSIGWLYHIVGDPSIGMVLECRTNFDFNGSSIESSECVLKIDKKALEEKWETIVAGVPLPRDPRDPRPHRPTDKEHDAIEQPALVDSEAWVDEVLKRAMWLAV